MSHAEIIDLHRARGGQMAEVRDEFDRFKWARGWAEDERITSSTAIAILGALLQHMSPQGECYPSVPTLARLGRCTERTVRRHLSNLEDLGWLKIIKRTGASNLYRAVTPDTRTPSSAVTPDTGDGGTPCSGVTPPPALVSPKQIREQRITTTTHTREAETKTDLDTNPNQNQAQVEEKLQKPDPMDIDLDRFIHNELLDQGLKPRIGEAQQIARRVILSELKPQDRRRYLVDWIARVAEKIQDGEIDRRTAIRWIGGAKSVAWWVADVKNARESEPIKKPAKRYAKDSIESNAEKCLERIQRLARQGGEP